MVYQMKDFRIHIPSFLLLLGCVAPQEALANSACDQLYSLFQRDFAPMLERRENPAERRSMDGSLHDSWGYYTETDSNYRGCNQSWEQYISRSVSPEPKQAAPRQPERPALKDPTSPRPNPIDSARKLREAESQAASDKSLNPWAGQEARKEPKTDGRAPYADKSCVDIKVAGSGISWDSTKIFNKCSFPVQVLTCYYDRGDSSKCQSYQAGLWGTSDTIKPRGATSSVSSAKRPGFGVRYIVCNMSGITNSSKLCLLPQS